MWRIFLILLLTLPLSAQQLTPKPVSLPIGYAMVNAAKGDVLIHSPKGEVLPVNRGQVLPVESTIETSKGSVLLDLQDGSQVLVKPHSRVVLKSPATQKGSYLDLLLGKVLSKIQKRLNNAPSFQMGTPSAVITVRGTQFLVEVNKDRRTTVSVYEGLVQVQGISEAGYTEPVFLGPGSWTEVETGREPSGPRQVAPPASVLQPGPAESAEFWEPTELWTSADQETQNSPAAAQAAQMPAQASKQPK